VWLQTNSVPFTEIDIEEHPAAAQKVRDMAGRIVTPCFEIDGEPVVDFDERRLRELLL
jgi:glutaredoxin